MPLFAKSMTRPQVHKMQPIVEFDERGEVTCRWDYVRPGAKPKEKFPFDRYFRNEKLNKYLGDLEAANQRYRVIKEKTKAQDLREDFRDFYRRIRAAHIKPMQAKQARRDVRRAQELADKKATTARKYRSAQRPVSDVVCLPGGALADGNAERDHFNTVLPQGEERPADGRRSRQFERAEERSQRIFAACSEYLEHRGRLGGMHYEIEEHEKFIQGLRQYSAGAPDPPIVLPRTSEQELQLALYQIRAAYEKKCFGTDERPWKPKGAGRRRSVGSRGSGASPGPLPPLRDRAAS